MTPTDDLRLVAETIGRAWTSTNGITVGIIPPVDRDDAEAARWLLPWLQRKAAEDPRTHLELSYYAMGGWETCLMRHHEDGDDVVLHRAGDHSFAAALFDLCLHIIKENPS